LVFPFFILIGNLIFTDFSQCCNLLKINKNYLDSESFTITKLKKSQIKNWVYKISVLPLKGYSLKTINR